EQVVLKIRPIDLVPLFVEAPDELVQLGDPCRHVRPEPPCNHVDRLFGRSILGEVIEAADAALLRRETRAELVEHVPHVRNPRLEPRIDLAKRGDLAERTAETLLEIEAHVELVELAHIEPRVFERNPQYELSVRFANVSNDRLAVEENVVRAIHAQRRKTVA